MLEKVPEKLNLPELDHQVLEFWKKHDVFQKSIDRPAPKGDYVFYDGPPGTNGIPHIGHMMQSALKDLWPRYRTMQGCRVLRKAGWDTHGLPVEMTADKELGFTSRRDVIEYGEQKYIDYCRSTVFRYKETWEKAIFRIGRFLDLENAYATYHPYYIQADWWTLKQAWSLELEGEAREKALQLGQSPRYLYRDYRVMPYSPRSGATLSNFEVAQGYQDVTELTLYVKFPVKGSANTYLTAWTTTPWTLLSNLAVAAGPHISYVTIELTSDSKAGKKGDHLILAEARLEVLKHLFGEFKVVGSQTGTELAGTEYEPLWDWLKPLETGADGKHTKAFTVLVDNYVTTEDGTGLVHLAFYGEDDFRIMRENGIGLFLAVGPDGCVSKDINVPGSTECGKFVGRDFREEGLDIDILKALHDKGLLLEKEKYTHSYPFDYRTGWPLMYFPRPAWFIRTTAIRDMMLKANSLIGWKPEHIREGRFGNWLENIADWNITRERYWGSPLPVWQTEDGSEAVCVGSLSELRELCEKSGNPLPDDFDPHKPYIDRIVLKAPDGREMRREDFVLDSWFNAGLMPWGQWGYPAEAGSVKQFDGQYPCDFICEGLDQTRGWFYTLLACSCLVAKAKIKEHTEKNDQERLRFWNNPRNWSSYKNVICTELVLDHEGRKMSKSVGNVVDPIALFEKFGADPVRWIFFATNPWNAKRFGEEEITDAVRTVILPLWNSYSFFMTYARIDDWKGVTGSEGEETLMDRWIISEKHRLIEEVIAALDNYDVATAGSAVTRFLDLLTNWYIRRSRRRFWKSENDADKLTAYAVLYGVLADLIHLLAPFLPFLTEYMYQNLVLKLNPDGPVSVHLGAYPVPDPKRRDEDLETRMDQVQKAVTLARALRQERNLKVRQPLKQMTWVIPDEAGTDGMESFLHIIADELNVRDVRIRHDDSDLVTLAASANFRTLGKRVGKRMPEVKAAIENMPQEAILQMDQGGSYKFEEFEFTREDIQIRRSERPGLALKSDGYMTVALDTELTAELESEGLAREVVHHIQNLRKRTGLEITDRIYIKLSSDSEALHEALSGHEQYIRRETLADKLEFRKSVGGETTQANGHPFTLNIEKACGPRVNVTEEQAGK